MRRVASIGECMIELSETSPGQLLRSFGGDTLNTAVYLARSTAGRGVAVDYVTALGDDPYSDEMLAAWEDEGVGTGLVARLPGRLPGLYAIRTDAAGERTFYYWRSAAAARERFRGGLGQDLDEKLAGYDLIYLSGISVSILDAESRRRLLALLDRLRGQGAKVVFDSNYRPRNWPGPEAARDCTDQVLARVDVALPGFDDEAELYGDATPEATARRLRRLGVAEVAVKNAAESCRLSWPEGEVELAAEPVEQVVDTTAAGDSFNAGYLAGRLCGLEPPEAARWGHRLASAVIQHRGAVVPRSAMPHFP